MTELEYCEHWCGKLTQRQEAVLKHRISVDQFEGVARPVGSMKWFPAVRLKGQSLNVIDSLGYLQLASLAGATSYPYEVPVSNI